MAVLPVIVGYGGCNAAGRSSFDQAYRRMILENLSGLDRERTIAGLACMMGLARWDGAGYVDDQGVRCDRRMLAQQAAAAVVDGTLIRRIEANHFDPDAVFCHRTLSLDPDEDGLRFRIPRRQLPEPLPAGWVLEAPVGDAVWVRVQGAQQWRIPATQVQGVKAAGQLPRGFDPGAGYNSRFQPRGLQMAIAGASDALHSLGVPWKTICAAVRPDQIGTYASCAMGQLGEEGLGGMLRAALLGGRATAKQLPLGLNSMPADFVNAYVLGSLGHTEAITGACASFLYNLHAAVRDIRRGARRVALVGGSEAPVTPEIIEGFANMNALATEEAMARLGDADPRRYSRPFGYNAGFVVGESAQYVFLMDDALAVELGLEIHGAVPEVCIDADGVKKSISGPGPGNYLSFGKAVAAARAILGEASLRRRSAIFAHGSSTPQNRVTESLIFDRLAEAFGIADWPVCAVKAYVGHSLATAGGDQLVTAIGALRHGWLPGIKTITEVAADVHARRLRIPLADLDLRDAGLDAAILNAKGFGGNNASGLVLSPAVAEAMLARRHAERWGGYLDRRERNRAAAAAYQERVERGQFAPIYRFGEDGLDDDALEISAARIRVPGFGGEIGLRVDNPYADMC
ncbi:MAG: beta-ketoacyl synthase [Pseudomonadota bacterium]